MNKKNLLLTALLAFQAVLVVLALLPEKKGGPKEITFFPGIKAEEVQELVIAEKEDKTLTLSRTDAGWKIAGAEEFPANAGKVGATVTKLAGLKSARLVTRTAASHSRLKVADHSYNRKLTLKAKDGRDATILLGSSPSTQMTHARLAGQKEVYLARDLSIWDIQTSPDSWWETKLVDIPDAAIQEVSLTNANGSLTLTRGEDNQWKAAGAAEILDQNAVRGFLDQVARLALAKYEGKEEKAEFGLKAPVATLLVKGKDTSLTVTIGPKDKEKNDHVVKSSGSPFYIRVAAITVEPFLARKTEDFRAGTAQGTTTGDPVNRDAGEIPPLPGQEAGR